MRGSKRNQMALALYGVVYAEAVSWDQLMACGDPEIRERVRADVYGAIDAILSVLSDPTDAMLKAGDDVILSDDEFHSGPFSTLKAEWRAMVAAVRSGA